jgi:hypothetical protein
MTSVGAIVALIMLITGHKPKKLGYSIYFEINNLAGGIDLGPFFLAPTNSWMHLKYHEVGHGLQNLIWGPIFPFLIAIPSCTRFWLRECNGHLKKVIFACVYFLITTIIFTGAICLVNLVLQLHCSHLIILLEFLRGYFAIITLWLLLIEIPQYDYKSVSYDSIWFEGQATAWGTKFCTKNN